ncbi:MAG: hypothetical protein KAJ19_09465, partial [Gammaproteobacteria bacterium]|nr:hypothetical protein [Gammaproteobacteria bacterium]
MIDDEELGDESDGIEKIRTRYGFRTADDLEGWAELFERSKRPGSKSEAAWLIDKLEKERAVRKRAAADHEDTFVQMNERVHLLEELVRQRGAYADLFYERIQSVGDCMAFSARDWSTDHRDAWLYGVIHGWDEDSLQELAAKHGWEGEPLARLRRLMPTTEQPVLALKPRLIRLLEAWFGVPFTLHHYSEWASEWGAHWEHTPEPVDGKFMGFLHLLGAVIRSQES